MHFKAVVFDLDGTLTNTLDDIAFAMNRSLRLHSLPEFPVEAYKYLVGDGAVMLARRACRERTDMAPSVLTEYQAYYKDHTNDRSVPYPGIEAMLAALTARGMRLAVFSNKPHADVQTVVKHYFPAVPFEVIRGQIEGVPVKPDPAGALAVAQEMGLEPADFLYLGDTGTDMHCAVNAGMHPVGVLWGFREEEELRESGAKAIIADPMALMELL